MFKNRVRIGLPGAEVIELAGLSGVANIIPGRSVLPFHPLSINRGVCSRCLIALGRTAPND